MQKEKYMMCDRCRKTVLLQEIRYVLKGKDSKTALCSECRTKNSIKEEKPGEKKIEKKPYYCARCNYKFKFNPENVAKLFCPYCGKDDKLEKYKSISANDWIELSKDGAF